jgi:hypothetical protein
VKQHNHWLLEQPEEKSMKTRRELILGHVEDLVSNFLYYDRKEDEDLPRGSIEEAVKVGEITVDEIVAEFDKWVRHAGGQEIG